MNNNKIYIDVEELKIDIDKLQKEKENKDFLINFLLLFFLVTFLILFFIAYFFNTYNTLKELIKFILIPEFLKSILYTSFLYSLIKVIKYIKLNLKIRKLRRLNPADKLCKYSKFITILK